MTCRVSARPGSSGPIVSIVMYAPCSSSVGVPLPWIS
jgi:hypothetical protein